MTERPNICYIFEKLSVQGCQIWHSHVPMSFNSASTHSTHPHNAKSSLRYRFNRNSWKFYSQKLLHQGYFWWRGNFFLLLTEWSQDMVEPNSGKSKKHSDDETSRLVSAEAELQMAKTMDFVLSFCSRGWILSGGRIQLLVHYLHHLRPWFSKCDTEMEDQILQLRSWSAVCAHCS